MQTSTITRTAVAAVILGLALAAAPASAQEAIFIVRHAERLDDTKDSALSPEGVSRAERLATALRDSGITAVFSTQYQRTANTGRPLAAHLGLPVTSVPADQQDDLRKQVTALGPAARVLIVGHSDTVPELLAAFGHANTITIAKDEYDNLFVLVPGAGSGPLLLRLRY
ncbi:MAG: histidine phosphatase family protein [Vicinamibacterales bacterium]|nr:histidine phosphatase family protein [Vicinamibacterales bacterium]